MKKIKQDIFKEVKKVIQSFDKNGLNIDEETVSKICKVFIVFKHYH